MGCEQTNAEPKSPRWLVPLLLLAPIIVIFAPVLFADRSFAFRDGAHFYHPLFQWITAEWGHGRVPLWNPQENCGLPVLADATSSIFYPAKLIFVLPLPFVWLYKFYIIGHVVFAALGMFAFARRLRASQQAAVLVGLAYACGGNVLFQYCNIVFLVGAAWLPFALLAIEEVVSRRCWRAMLFLAFVLAMMILGGDPQMALHVLLAAGLRIVSAYFHPISLAPVLRGEGRGEGLKLTEPSISISSLTFPSALFGAAAVLAFLLAAVQIFPSSEATKSSERAAYNRPRNIYEAAAVLSQPAEPSPLAETKSEKIRAGLFGQPEQSSHHDRAYDFSVSPWRVSEFLWPNISGKAFPQNQRWTSRIPGESKPWTPTLYLGLLPFLAGVAALRWWLTDATTRWLTWLVVVFALGSLGWYGLGWLANECYSLVRREPTKIGLGSPVGGVYWLMVTLLPSYIYFRYPAKLLVVAVCALLGISAPAADRLFEKKSERWLLTFKAVAIISMVIAFSLWCASPYLLKLKPSPSQVFGPFVMTGALFDVFVALAHTTLVAALLFWIASKIWEATSAKDAETITRWKWAAVMLTAAELVVANGWLIFTAPGGLWKETAPVTVAIEQHDPGRSTPPRFFRGSYYSWSPASFAKQGSSARMEEIARWDHDTLSHKYFLPSGMSLVESYGSLKSVDYEALLLQARVLSPTKIDGVAQPLGEALRLTACEYLVLPSSAKVGYAERLPENEQIKLPENVSLWRMKRTWPRAHVVEQVIQLPLLANPLDLTAVDERANLVLAETRESKLKVRDFSSLAVVETSEKLSLPAPEVATENEPLAATAEIVLDEPQHVRIKTTLAKPGLLVLSDSWNPGWVATRQTSSAAAKTSLTIHRTNRCFRGVELPAGEWLVDFEYRPQSFYRGAFVSTVAWIGLLAVVMVSLFRNRSPC